MAGAGFTPRVTDAVLSVSGVETAHVENGRLFLGLTEAARTPDVVRAAVESGADIEEVRRGTETLEEAFMSLLEGGDHAS